MIIAQQQSLHINYISRES